MNVRARGGPSTLDLETRGIRRAPTWALAVLVLGATIYVVLFLSAILEPDTDLIQGLTIAPILVAATVPIALRIARSDNDPTIAAIVLAGVVAKLVFAWLRYWVAWDYYGSSSSDSLQYHLEGSVLAPSYRGLDFSPDVGSLTGTGFVKMVTGIVYAIVGTSPVAGFVVFAWIGFLGLLLMSRAFKIGVPSGDSRRYLVLVLFLPSLLYWPSSIGKEAWMTLALGLCAYGVAALFARRSEAIPVLVVGFLAVGAVRPHIGLIVFIGLALAALLRRAPARTYAAPFLRHDGRDDAGRGRRRHHRADDRVPGGEDQGQLPDRSTTRHPGRNHRRGFGVQSGRGQHAARHGPGRDHGLLPTVPVRSREPARAPHPRPRGLSSCSSSSRRATA